MHPRLFSSLVLIEPVMDICINTCQGPALTRISTSRRDLWESRQEAIKAARKSYKGWDKRVLRRWFEYGYRALPTAIYPQSKLTSCSPEIRSSNLTSCLDLDRWIQDRWPEDDWRPLTTEEHKRDEGPVTLATTKHQEVFSYLRPNFKGFTSEPNTASAQIQEDIDKMQFADVVGPPGTTVPFYRAEPIIAHAALPHIRPSVLYVFGGRSPLSLPELRASKLERTGVGIGGSGGFEAGKVKEVVLPKSGHLAPMEDVNGCAEATFAWLCSVAERWKTREARFLASWEEQSLKEKATVSSEWVEKVKSLL
jgi:pimeloyl-ACP methyl ester carboxylesterase